LIGKPPVQAEARSLIVESVSRSAIRRETTPSRPYDMQVSGRTDRGPERAIVMAIVVLVILARSAIFVFWEQAHFDSDQAVFGLMAKHLSEGRAFPMFMYGGNYILAVESWLAAPVFLVAGASVAALKTPLLIINIAVGLLLVWLLEREAGLRPAVAALAAVFFILPPPGTAAELVNVAGTNLEPFLYVLLIWITRRRPVWCGLIVGIGFLQREFTLYAPLALLIIGGACGVLFTRDNVRRVFAAARVAAEVWLVAALLKPYSSAAGPGTSIADVAATNNVSNLVARVCLDRHSVVSGVWSIVGGQGHWARLFGLRVEEPLLLYGIDSRVIQGSRGMWVVLTIAMVLALARVARSVVTQGRVSRTSYFPAYLVLVGLISGGAFVVGRCGAQGNLRYTLLSIFAAVGLGAWYLQIEERRLLKTIWMALVAVWMLDAASGHGRLWAEYLRQPPSGFKRLVIRHLEARGVRYGMTDYWNAYYISFLTNERIVMQATDLNRIHTYDREIAAHLNEAVKLSRTPCAGPGGEMILPGAYLCPLSP
jgi:hypothetical protein